ncbi:phytanoyl-CoA dioxygenase family protein [uncultured Kriegella sp.]|uniref:phytanoyl-CoA dioxygenase family protein n=1 Tax=uncultured Kriegella sp. TaxID=1798910 RepID=UPI0030DAA949|tara:strand:+ start:105804 stop:106523 length:720 start_codon:yes stop_codon:yes gene_type:complete
MNELRKQFCEQGYAKLDDFLSSDEANELRLVYDALLSDKQRTMHLRSDLAGSTDENKVERITQIMRPSSIEKKLLAHSAYKKALNLVKVILGEDMELDFDMLINKAPHTDTPTPWHQDAAYWIDLPDKRAASCWIALDKVFEGNGCMWFLPVTDQKVLAHQNLPNGGALYCETETSNAVAVPLAIGGCTFHDGFTLHFSRGNSTSGQRRALILNFRPKKMIALEREQGMDHTGTRKKRS